MKLAQALEHMKKSQLQAYYQHWFPRETMERSRAVLVEKLKAAMTDPAEICRKFDVLKPSEKGFIQALLLLDNCSGSVNEIRRQRPARRIEDFELESVLRRLREQGFLHKSPSAERDGQRIDCFTIPEEIARALNVTVEVEKRGVGELLSLAAARKRKGRTGSSVADTVSIEAVRERVKSLSDPTLRAVIWSTLEDYGGILTLSVWRRAGSTGRLNRSPWRKELEEKELGTTGILNLKEYGIDLEEEALCVYQEIVYAHGLAQAEEVGGENDVELCVGADLVVDLSRLLQIVYIEPLDLTRDGYLYKRTEEKLSERFVLSSHQNLFEGRVLEHLVSLATKLKLVVRSEGKLRISLARVKVWEKRSVLLRMKKIFDLFL